jgi:hypothetical protein
MKSEAVMEYEIIKLLREVQIMRRLNHISNKFFGNNNHPFVPELIDIITPQLGITQSKSLDRGGTNDRLEMDLS